MKSILFAATGLAFILLACTDQSQNTEDRTTTTTGVIQPSAEGQDDDTRLNTEVDSITRGKVNTDPNGVNTPKKVN